MDNLVSNSSTAPIRSSRDPSPTSYWVRAADAYAKADEYLAEEKGKAARRCAWGAGAGWSDIRLFLQD